MNSTVDSRLSISQFMPLIGDKKEILNTTYTTEELAIKFEEAKQRIDAMQMKK